MTQPDETKSEGMRTVSPPSIKRERSDDEEPARRVAQRLETDQEPESEDISEKEEEAMVQIVIHDLMSDDEDTLAHDLDRLGDYLNHDDDEKMAEKAKVFFQIGGHLAVVSVMKRHPNSRDLQYQAICVLLNATYGGSSEENKSAVAMIEGIQTILTAMKRFPQDRDVICVGFGALWNIVYEHEANADLLVMKLGEVSFLVKRMKAFKSRADVMLDACRLMLHLADFEQLREPMIGGNAITALGSAIEIHGDDTDIQESAREALVALLNNDSD